MFLIIKKNYNFKKSIHDQAFYFNYVIILSGGMGMHAWESIQNTLLYIEEHIGEEISIEQLAEIAALSPFYYQRLFSRLVKKPVGEYIKLRRLARACDMLLEKKNIIDIALFFGFKSHETFTRAFKETYGITPKEYRKDFIQLKHFDNPDLLLNNVVADEGVPLISDGLVLEMNIKNLKEAINFLGVKGYIPFNQGKMYSERTGIDLPEQIWENFFTVLKDIPHHDKGRFIGVCYQGDAPSGYTTYYVGVETTLKQENNNFISWELPSREYLVCGFEAENDQELTGNAIGRAMAYTRFWLKNHGLRAENFFPEIYYQNEDGAASYMELWIPFIKREN